MYKRQVYTLDKYNVGFDAGNLPERKMYIVCKESGKIVTHIEQINGVAVSDATFDDAIFRYASQMILETMSDDISDSEREEFIDISNKVTAYLERRKSEGTQDD